jgi:hypothetical protein
MGLLLTVHGQFMEGKLSSLSNLSNSFNLIYP